MKIFGMTRVNSEIIFHTCWNAVHFLPGMLGRKKGASDATIISDARAVNDVIKSLRYHQFQFELKVW